MIKLNRVFKITVTEKNSISIQDLYWGGKKLIPYNHECEDAGYGAIEYLKEKGIDIHTKCNTFKNGTYLITDNFKTKIN